MDMHHTRPADTWSPLYFLASVGAGGLAVTFFMYLMFWVSHPGQPVPIFEDILAAFVGGGAPLKAAIVVAVLGIAAFAATNIWLLVWNLGRMRQFHTTDAYKRLVNSNGETQFLAMPLALAMTVNAGFILGLVFMPGLWGVVEYLFPMAMVAFALIAFLAFKRIGDFLGRVLSEGGIFDVTANNSFAQLLPAFALAMTAVGMAAPAAMSTVPLTVGISMVASIMLGTVAGLYAFGGGHRRLQLDASPRDCQRKCANIDGRGAHSHHPGHHGDPAGARSTHDIPGPWRHGRHVASDHYHSGNPERVLWPWGCLSSNAKTMQIPICVVMELGRCLRAHLPRRCHFGDAAFLD
jgi:hypothetical protein